ncbi:MAG: nicotinamide riboside transporter PnuC [Candidatus Marinimicrobia bacterium]|nr:nicotinamide riboside transporter PnuC [Candidatus Neomarinimicrobiota bacterium]
MFAFLNINQTLFTFLGYEMSYLEFFGTVFNLWCVWLFTKNKSAAWPIGILGIILYIFLFYQIQLYSDLFEQFYFLITSFYGWWMWTKVSKKMKGGQIKISYSSLKGNLTSIVITLVGTVLLTVFMLHVHEIFPIYFPKPASVPFLDAFTTIMSFVATILMAKKKVESWYFWILVDIIGIGLYYYKGVKFIALEYLIFLGMAVMGFFNWKKEFQGYRNEKAKLTQK